MVIRKAENKDINGIMRLLRQVLEIHAEIRPDIFIGGTSKYTETELSEILTDESRPVYVALSDDGNICGYAFCVLEDIKGENAVYPHKSLYIDDLCVDSRYRGKHIGKDIFEFVKCRARECGCKDITLAVWEGNEKAYAFYEKMGMTVRKKIMEIKVER